jgi:hypothetical protein
MKRYKVIKPGIILASAPKPTGEHNVVRSERKPVPVGSIIALYPKGNDTKAFLHFRQIEAAPDDAEVTFR